MPLAIPDGRGVAVGVVCVAHCPAAGVGDGPEAAVREVGEGSRVGARSLFCQYGAGRAVVRQCHLHRAIRFADQARLPEAVVVFNTPRPPRR